MTQLVIPSEEEKLKSAVDTMVLLLRFPSGATDFQLRKAAYYAATTWHLWQFDRFPFLVLYGSTGTGKSSLMEGLSEFCLRPVEINISSETPATLRKSFDDANNGTALIEESEDPTMSAEVEAYLRNRYARATGKARKSVPTGARGWKVEEYFTFGATILHRRDHFADPAIENRAIWLPLQLNTARGKSSYGPVPQDLATDVVQVLSDTGGIRLTDASSILPESVLGRVADNYEPLLGLAKLLDDRPFIAELNNELKIATAAFRDGQTYSPRALVFKALLACLTVGEQLNLNRSVFVERQICKHLQNYYAQGLKPRAASKYLRELGFRLGQSGGFTKVMGITVPQLSKASLETGVVDDLLAKIAGEGSPKLTPEDMELERD